MKNLFTTGILLIFFGICFAVQAQIPCGSPAGGNCTNPASDYSHIMWRNPSDLFNTPLSPVPLSEVNQNLFYFTDDIPPVPLLGCPNGVPQTTINDFGATTFTTGDEIGLFFERNDTLLCVGYWVHLNDASSTESIVVYGDDIGTTIQESYGNGEQFEIMLIRKNGFANYYVNFEIDGVNDYPCGSVFADPNGDFTDKVDSRLESLTVLDCNGIENGPNRLDNCGVCDDDSSNDNTTCFSCNDPAACNYIADATNIDNATCDYGNTECADPCNYILGCTSINASNFDPLADCDDGSCISCIQLGCTNPNACNYNDLADCDDESCIYETTCDSDPCTNGGIYAWDATACSCVLVEPTVLGCTDTTFLNYNPTANCDDGSGCTPIEGCMDAGACNYNSAATVDDGSCDFGDPFCPDPCNVVYGCTDSSSPNYNPIATCDVNGCPATEGCMNANACNYNPAATVDDGSCNLGDTNCPEPCNAIYGCTDPLLPNYNPSANCDDGVSCEYYEGCIDVNACNYNILANLDDGSCIFETTCDIDPCTDGGIYAWDATACSCILVEPTIEGCTDPSFLNYDSSANCDDASCVNDASCSDPNACNFDPDGGFVDNSTCNYGNTDCPEPCNPISGCTDVNACNYNSIACLDDGSCILETACDTDPCTNGGTYAWDATTCSCTLTEPTPEGCTDINACNYDPLACIDDNSCLSTLPNTGIKRDGALYGITDFPVSGNEIYTWFNENDEQVAQFTNNPYFAPSEVGTYYLIVSDPDNPNCTQLLGPATITDINGCCELESADN